jgi:hypothetical protein
MSNISGSLVPITDLEEFLKTPLYKPYIPLSWVNIEDCGDKS